MQTITTKSGTIYRLFGGRVARNNTSSFTLVKEPYCINKEDVKDATTWTEIWAAPKHPIQVGLCLMVEGRDEWWLSTPIASIEETDEEQ